MNLWTATIIAIGLLGFAPQDLNTPPAPTRVVRFTPQAAPKGSARPGNCLRSLVSDRIDAYRCNAAETTYDPCFPITGRGLVVCDADPRDITSGVLVTATLPSAFAWGPRDDSRRAWFFELEDGSTCRPLISGGGREVDGMVELYTCRFAPPGSDAVLGEIDTRAPVWTIPQASLNKRAPPISIKQVTSAVVKIAWQ